MSGTPGQAAWLPQASCERMGLRMVGCGCSKAAKLQDYNRKEERLKVSRKRSQALEPLPARCSHG